MKTDHQALVDSLAKRGRRYSIQVYSEGSKVMDCGVYGGRPARPTYFLFNRDGQFLIANRLLKAAWLARGTKIKVWG